MSIFIKNAVNAGLTLGRIGSAVARMIRERRWGAVCVVFDA
jgi:hypothetical protein